jgi:hypothetical protein
LDFRGFGERIEGIDDNQNALRKACFAIEAKGQGVYQLGVILLEDL